MSVKKENVLVQVSKLCLLPIKLRKHFQIAFFWPLDPEFCFFLHCQWNHDHDDGHYHSQYHQHYYLHYHSHQHYHVHCPNLLARVSLLFCNPVEKMSNPVGNFACFALCLLWTILILIFINIFNMWWKFSSTFHLPKLTFVALNHPQSSFSSTFGETFPKLTFVDCLLSNLCKGQSQHNQED